MSMIGWVLGVSELQIAVLRAAPSLVSDLVWLSQSDATDARLKEQLKLVPPEKRIEAEARLKAVRAQFPGAQKEAEAQRERLLLAGIEQFEPALDLEKSWHILHYLFTGDVGPIGSPGDALLSGEDMGEDVGYGPARLLEMDATGVFAAFLAAHDVNQLMARVNYQRMVNDGIYGMPMGGGTEEEFVRGLRAEIGSYFPQLRDYVAEMAAKRNGLLIWIS